MKFALKILGLWLALLIGQVGGGMIAAAIAPLPPAGAADGPLSAPVAMLVITAIYAVMLAALAARLRWDFWGRTAVLFGVLYGVETIQAGIEAIYFNTYLKLAINTLIVMFVGGAIKSAVAALAGAWLWRASRTQEMKPLGGLVWKFPLIAVLYIAVYFTAGALIAWQGAEVRAYYGQGMHIDQVQLAGLQFVRGLLWAALALIIVRSVDAGIGVRALLTGGAFAVFLSVSLLYPIGFMPWAVRKMHLLEVFSSDLVFGVLAALILMKKVRNPNTTP